MSKLIGTSPNQVPTNADLGTMAYQDYDAVAPQLLGGRRNLIINGDMRIAQRSTSETGLTSTSSYTSLDRFYIYQSEGTTTQEQSTDAPDDFSYSFKITYTTAATFPATAVHQINYKIEGQDLQHLNYGSSSAKSTTISFWMKSNVTGKRIVRLYIPPSGGTAQSIQTYVTQNSADTWEYKTVTFDGCTTKSIPNSNAEGLRFTVWYGAGSNFTSATLPTTWDDYDSWVNAHGIDNVGGTNNDYFAITGVQIEVGSVATPFEHKSYGEELASCLRYFWAQCAIGEATGGLGNSGQKELTYGGFLTDSQVEGTVQFPVIMRTTPSKQASSGSGHFGIETSGGDKTFTTLSAFAADTGSVLIYRTGISGTNAGNGARWIAATTSSYLYWDAEL